MTARTARGSIRARMIAALKSEKGYVDDMGALVAPLLVGLSVFFLVLSLQGLDEEAEEKPAETTQQGLIISKAHEEAKTVTTTVCKTVAEVETCEPTTEDHEETWALIVDLGDKTITTEVTKDVYDDYQISDKYVMPVKD